MSDFDDAFRDGLLLPEPAGICKACFERYGENTFRLASAPSIVITHCQHSQTGGAIDTRSLPLDWVTFPGISADHWHKLLAISLVDAVGLNEIRRRVLEAVPPAGNA